MPANNKDFVTMCYDNYPDQREFVFSMKGRPFSMLSTQRLPVPPSNLIDYNLVRDLGLKMSDLQCSKFNFGGQKFRILGKISQTVQTITNGVISGTAHLSANVVENLSNTFDSHSIAGKKITEMLTRKITSSPKLSTSSPVRSQASSPPAVAPSPPSASARARKKLSVVSPKPLDKVSTPLVSTPSPRPSSPPGFPDDPQYSPPRLRYGRVIYKSKNVSRVLSFREDGGENLEMFLCKDEGLSVSVNSVVAFNDHSSLVYPTIMNVYSKQRGQLLDVPECPPEYLPAGYYG